MIEAFSRTASVLAGAAAFGQGMDQVEVPFLVFITCVSCLIVLSISEYVISVSTWLKMARLHPDRPFAPDMKFKSLDGYFGGLVPNLPLLYRGCINIGINQEAIRISIFPLFRPLHPPMVIGWDKVVDCSRTRFLLSEAVKLDFEGSSQPIWIFGGKFFWVRKQFVNPIAETWQKSREDGAKQI